MQRDPLHSPQRTKSSGLETAIVEWECEVTEVLLQGQCGYTALYIKLKLKILCPTIQSCVSSSRFSDATKPGSQSLDCCHWQARDLHFSQILGDGNTAVPGPHSESFWLLRQCPQLQRPTRPFTVAQLQSWQLWDIPNLHYPKEGKLSCHQPCPIAAAQLSCADSQLWENTVAET